MINRAEKHLNYRADIDGLRAVAVLSVVIFHAFPAVMPGGFVGVDVFFVISGFLISTIIFKEIDKGSFTFYDFYARRIRRIFPALIVVSFFCYVAGWFLLFPDEFSQLGKHLFGGSAFISNFILINESGYFDNSAESKPLLHFWSLAIEEQFYFIWPLLLVLFAKNKKDFLRVVVAGFIISFAVCVYKTRLDPSTAFYLPYTRFWELLAGGGMAWSALYLSNTLNTRFGSKVNEILSFSGVLLLIFSFVFISSKSNFPGFLATLPVLAAVFIISSGPDALINKFVLSNKIFVWIGKVSFPLYLWHWPILSFLRIVSGGTPSAWEICIAVAVSMFLAWLTFEFVEKRVRFRKGRVTIISLCSCMVIVGCLGALSYKSGGFPSRVSIEAYMANRSQLIREPSIDDECIKKMGGDKPLFDYCRYSSANTSKNVIVFGDSHAHAAFPGIAKIMSEKGYNTILLANSSCPPFVGTFTGETAAQQEFCTKRITELLEKVKKIKNIEGVFVFTRGAKYLTGRDFGNEGQADHSVMINAEDFKIGAQKTINKLMGVSKKIFFVSENPELRFTASSCLPRPLGGAAHNCTVDRSSVDIRQHEHMKILTSLNNITVIDSRNVFCSALYCSPFSDKGTLLYADDNHISQAGSEYQARMLSDYLN